MLISCIKLFLKGPDIIDTDEKLGIIPRAMNYLFSSIMNSSEDIEFNVKVSFLELYNEKLQDLIDRKHFINRRTWE